MTDRLVWIDCEMTGLDLTRDALVEIACIVTDGDLNAADDGIDVIIKPPAEALDHMPPVVREMHTASGLLNELATDPRFSTPQAMFEHRVEGTRLLDEVFATKTLAEWKQTLSGIKGVWSPVQQGTDLYDDPQVVANGYLGDVTAVGGNTFQLVANPVQFDEVPNQLVRAPELGEHTDDVLRQAGYDEERILALKIDNAIL